MDWEDPLEEKVVTHSSIPAWKNPMDRGTWWAMVHGGHQKSQAQRDSRAHTHGQVSLRVFQEAGGLHLKGTSCISHLEK